MTARTGGEREEMRVARVWPSSSGFNAQDLAARPARRHEYRHQTGELRDKPMVFSWVPPVSQSNVADVPGRSQIYPTYGLEMGSAGQPRHMG